MIVSVSRRTDVPALYGQWFVNRLKEGFVYQVNPFNRKQVHRIPLSKDAVDAFVFWTKNPAPFMKHLPHLKGIPFYFHFTLTPYDETVEPAFKDKTKLLESFRHLSESIGKERVIWRYDPVIVSERFKEAWHETHFRAFASALEGYTERVVVSFVDFYKKARRPLEAIGAFDPDKARKKAIIRKLHSIAKEKGMTLELCSEALDMKDDGVHPTRCVDPHLIERIGGTVLNIPKDPNQRKECGCVVSKDIGAYDTCTLGCKYCYAVRSGEKSRQNRMNHDPDSPLLNGHLKGDETIYGVNLDKYR